LDAHDGIFGHGFFHLAYPMADAHHYGKLNFPMTMLHCL
jgi:hypothetical protein